MSHFMAVRSRVNRSTLWHNDPWIWLSQILKKLGNQMFLYQQHHLSSFLLRFEISVVKPTCRCGQRTTRRIVGGDRVLPGEWPWQAGLIIKNTSQIFCGGALISKEWIATGAHCVTFRNASSLLVVLGEYDVTRKEGIEIYREVDGFYRHPHYDIVTADFDIALVHFTPPLNRFSRFVSPVCLPTTNDSFQAGTNCTVTGYGRLAEGGRLATSLQQAVVPIVSGDTCQKAFPEFSITPRMMCAGYVRGGIDACQGDSGGPLVCRKDKIHWFLGGIISWGLGCARPNSYGIYANVTVLATWIHSTLANYTICEPWLSYSYWLFYFRKLIVPMVLIARANAPKNDPCSRYCTDVEIPSARAIFLLGNKRLSNRIALFSPGYTVIITRISHHQVGRATDQRNVNCSPWHNLIKIHAALSLWH